MESHVYSIHLFGAPRSVKLVTRTHESCQRSVKKNGQIMIVMAVVDQCMHSVQHGYQGVSVTMQHRRTDASKHAYSELSKREQGEKSIKAT